MPTTGEESPAEEPAAVERRSKRKAAGKCPMEEGELKRSRPSAPLLGAS